MQSGVDFDDMLDWYAANVMGLTRHSFYQCRERDPEFTQAWDDLRMS
ncbi:MAG: hypothetical protein ABJ360_27045 [Roseobacter sp.]